jgi:hypothetical protein
MSEVDYPSGKWIGFYTYADSSQRHLMDLVLAFRAGAISGEGADGIGFFGIDGRYDAQQGECNWTKTYFGSHSVWYAGFREKKGIWGTWRIGALRGGFHIWPIGEGAWVEQLSEGVEQPLVVQATEHTDIATTAWLLDRVAARRATPAEPRARLT